MANDVAEVRPLTHAEFQQIRVLAHEVFCLDLREGKEQLVSARLGKLVRKLGCLKFSDYCNHVRADTTGVALAELIDALTTNFTSFLREPAHFDFLTNTILPEFDGRRIDIWSAACSTGEEPYSIAIYALECLGEKAREQVRILATDISTRALEGGKQGVYQSERLAGLPAPLLRKYFLKGEQRWKGWFRASPHLRSMVEFRRMNLMESFPSLPSFAAIFCRNVMIYFDQPTQHTLVSKLARCLAPGGYLLTGHSESLLRGHEALEYVRPAVYRKPAGGGRSPAGTRSR